MYICKGMMEIIQLSNMLHICMTKEDSVLKEIELLLEEKFSKIGMYYEVAEL